MRGKWTHIPVNNDYAARTALYRFSQNAHTHGANSKATIYIIKIDTWLYVPIDAARIKFKCTIAVHNRLSCWVRVRELALTCDQMNPGDSGGGNGANCLLRIRTFRSFLCSLCIRSWFAKIFFLILNVIWFLPRHRTHHNQQQQQSGNTAMQ